MIITIGTRQLAVGVEWSYADSKATVRAHLKAAKGRHVVNLVSDVGENWIGIIEKGIKEKFVFAGAALVGLVVPSAIIAQSIGNGLSWLCVIQDGKPVVGHDQIVSSEECDQIALGMMSMFQQADLYGDIPNAKNTLESLFDEIDIGVKEKRISKVQLENCKLKKHGISKTALTRIAISLIVIFALIIFWDKYKNKILSDGLLGNEAKRLAFEALTKAQKEAEKAKHIAAFNELVAKKRKELDEESRLYNVISAWGSWNNTRRSIPLSAAGGYKPESMKCKVNSCTIEWIGKGKFTRISDQALITDKKITGTNKKFSSNVALSDIVTASMEPLSISADEFKFNLIDQMIGSNINLDKMQAVVIKYPENENLKLPPVTIGHRGNIKIQTNGYSSLVEIQKIISKLSKYPIKLDSIAYTGIGKSIGIEISASYIILNPEL